MLCIHASSAARFEQSIRNIAERVKIKGHTDLKADILRLFGAWLGDSQNGRWLIILDNADDASFLVDSPVADSGSAAPSLSDHLPMCEHGSILVTSRSKGAALQLGEDSDIIDVHPMTAEHALELLEKKIGAQANQAELREMAAALECMPLALTQAAAYIRRRGSRTLPAARRQR